MNHTSDLISALAQHTDQVIFAVEVSTNQFLYLNPAFEKFQENTGTCIETPLDFFRVIHDEDKDDVIRAYQDLLKDYTKKEVEFRVKIHDSTERWFFVSAFLIENEGEFIISGSIQDISKWKQPIAPETNHAVLDILAHDLAGPLGSVQILSSFLLGKMKEHDDKEINKWVRSIKRISNHGVNLIKNLIEKEFLETEGEAILVKKQTNVTQKIRDLISQYQGPGEEYQVTFTFSSAPENIFSEIDEHRFMQAINNLISNSVKFTPENGVISITISKQDETILIRVKDNGIGIAEKYHDIVFEKSGAARKTGLKGEPSSGLGLSLAKTIVEYHHGKIWFESEENKGTSFFVSIPATAASLIPV